MCICVPYTQVRGHLNPDLKGFPSGTAFVRMVPNAAHMTPVVRTPNLSVIKFPAEVEKVHHGSALHRWVKVPREIRVNGLPSRPNLRPNP